MEKYDSLMMTPREHFPFITSWWMPLGAGHESIISGNKLWHPMRQGIGQ
jgi:hypothetical protein